VDDSSAVGQTDPLMLLNTYLTTVNDPIPRWWWQRRPKRSLIVMLTKADMLRADAPPEVRTYLESDPFTRLVNQMDFVTPSVAPTEWWDEARCQQYAEEMDAISDRLKDWFMASATTCRVFVGTCEDHGIDVRFCVTSAGEPFSTTVNGRHALRLTPKPYRVVDPVITALQMTNGRLSDLARLRSFLQSWNLLGRG
jgi:hypothetical protein